MQRTDAECWLENSLEYFWITSCGLAGFNGFCQVDTKLYPVHESAQPRFYTQVHEVANNIRKRCKENVLGDVRRNYNMKEKVKLQLSKGSMKVKEQNKMRKKRELELKLKNVYLLLYILYARIGQDIILLIILILTKMEIITLK